MARRQGAFPAPLMAAAGGNESEFRSKRSSAALGIRSTATENAPSRHGAPERPALLDFGRAPFLSMVVPTRNDTYANVPAAQNACLAILQHQLEGSRIESEIVVVDYSPDPGLKVAEAARHNV
jgi:hypothetical protein